MGIQGLTRLLQDNVPSAIKEGKIDNLFGRKIAMDASMAIYQFLIAVRQAGGEGQLTNEAGEVFSMDFPTADFQSMWSTPIAARSSRLRRVPMSCMFDRVAMC